jgi:hypothetical protein
VRWWLKLVVPLDVMHTYMQLPLMGTFIRLIRAC